MNLKRLEDYRDRQQAKIVNNTWQGSPDFKQVVKDMNLQYPGFLDYINATAKHSAIEECIQEAQKD